MFEAIRHRSAPADHVRARIRRAIDHIQAHLADPVGLVDLADIACYSPWHFDRLFRTLIGVSPMGYLTLARIAEARRRISLSGEPIISIAYDVGYNSIGSFGKRFTALVGTSPSHLRRAVERFERGRFMALASLAAEQRRTERPCCVGSVGFGSNRESETGFVFLALQRRGRMTPRPLACAVVRAPGAFALPLPPKGAFQLAALGFPDSAPDRMFITQDDAPRAQRDLIASGGSDVLAGKILLGPPAAEHPPIPPVFPLLLHGRFAVDQAA